MNKPFHRLRSLCLAAPAVFLTGGVLCAHAQSTSAPVQAGSVGQWRSRHVQVPAAAWVDLSHLGAHTHANTLRFNTGSLDVAAMLADNAAQHYRGVRVVGHCRLSTDHAALPPGFEALQGSVGTIPTYGSIDGAPGWSHTASTQKGRHEVTFSVPTRFANWVAGQPVPLRRRYKDPKNYSLEVTWEEN